MSRTLRLAGMMLAISIALAALLPGPASAGGETAAGLQVTLETRFLEVKDVFLKDVGVDIRGLGSNNWVVVVGSNGVGGPDIVIGDTAGIADPVPAPFMRVSDGVIRAPASEFAANLDIRPELGFGKDTLTITFGINPLLSDLTEVHGSLGKGADKATDTSKFADFLSGGPGPDRIDTGPGRDRLLGGPGIDLLKGGTGFDHLNGGGQRDRCNGGPGKDAYIHCEFVEGHPFP